MIDRGESVSWQVDILRSTGELLPAELEAIAIRLQEYAEESAEPVFVRVLLGLGGWLTAILPAVSAQFILKGEGLLPCGLALLAVAVGLSRAVKGIFLSQLALALAMVGNIGILAGAASVVRGDALPILTVSQFVLCLILYPLLRHAALRFAAPVSVAVFVAVWIVERDALRLLHLLVAAELILLLALSLRKRRLPAYLPIEKAAALLLPVTLLVFSLAGRAPSAVPLWPSGLLLCGGLTVLLFHPAVGLPIHYRHWMFGLSAVSLIPGLFTSPGVPAALLLLVLGRARGERYLTILGGLFLPVFLGFYFHALDIDLAYKAGVIAGSGFVLLGVRRLTAHCRSGEEIQCAR
jgi:hypothetical protein